MSLERILMEKGAPVLAKIIGQRFGKEAGAIAEVGLGALAEAFGLPAGTGRQELEAVVRPDTQAVARKIAEAEANMPDLLLAQAELQRARNEQQGHSNALLMAAMDKGPLWTWAWLYVWQYFLMGLWAWTLVLVYLVNAALRLLGDATQLPAPPIPDLLTLTGLYLGLHMGGHTVLELMRNKWGRANPDPSGD